ncbi:MAG: TlpA family protein disulfide reductase, partial [Wenzhouxiangellaceae bacterium]
MRWLAILGVAAIVGVAAGFTLTWLTRPDQGTQFTRPVPVIEVGQRRPEFVHAGLDGALWRASDFDGAPLLVNFWATWCQPCIREMPMLDTLHASAPQGLRVIGIAIDEARLVGPFVERLGIDYPILIGTDDVHETRNRYGNPAGLLPYSVLVDGQGIVRWRHLGELDEALIEQALASLT